MARQSEEEDGIWLTRKKINIRAKARGRDATTEVG